MAALSHFSEDVSEEELNALIQKAIPEKTKIATKYGLKNLKCKKKRILSINLTGSLDEFSNKNVNSTP